MANDIAGQKFGKLTAIRRDPNFEVTEKLSQRWICRCECCEEVSVPMKSLRSGLAQDCGGFNHNAKNFVGKRFGKLVVVAKGTAPGGSVSSTLMHYWVCRCDCGKTISVPQYRLVNGSKTDCGCKRLEAPTKRLIDMTGQKFGRLTALEPALLEKPTCSGTRWGWRCQCDCGNEKIVPRASLVSGQTKSCGCLATESSKKSILEKNVLGLFEGTKISAIKPGRKVNRRNKSGTTGVCWDKKRQRWTAQITVQRKVIRLGAYIALEDAVAARKAAEEKYYAPIIAQYEAENQQA